jgi:hypothetical protein
LWSDNPLSIYAKPLTDIIDGTIYYDVERDMMLRKHISEERNRLIQKMLAEKKSGAPVQAGTPSFEVLLNCGDHAEHNGLITIDENADDADAEINSNK